MEILHFARNKLHANRKYVNLAQNQRFIKIYTNCSRLFESTEIKIAGKRRIEPEWSGQTGAFRIEKGWS